jgi:hypothetical protein
VIGATDVPLWAALLTGLAGGVLGTLFTIGHERGAEFRTRMLTAADEFLQALSRAVDRAGEANALLKQNRVPRARLDEALAELEAACEELGAMLVRINLLFGGASRTWESASGAEKAVRDSAAVLQARRAGKPDDQNLYVYFAAKLKAAADSFGADVRRDVRDVGLRPMRWVVDTTRMAPSRALRRTAVPRYRLRTWLSNLRTWPARLRTWAARLRQR